MPLSSFDPIRDGRWQVLVDGESYGDARDRLDKALVAARMPVPLHPDSATLYPTPTPVDADGVGHAWVLHWSDGQAWICAELEGVLGWARVIPVQSGELIWPRTPIFLPHPDACEVFVGSNNPALGTVTWLGPVPVSTHADPGAAVPPSVLVEDVPPAPHRFRTET